MTLYEQWLEAKYIESEAAKKRRAIEDQLASELSVDTTVEGSKSYKIADFKIKTTVRMNRRIDADALQEIAREHGLTDMLGSLFRWKPELNMREWKAASEEITKPFLAAITTEPGRPSFSIEYTGE